MNVIEKQLVQSFKFVSLFMLIKELTGKGRLYNMQLGFILDEEYINFKYLMKN